MSNIKSLEKLIEFELAQNAKEAQRQADQERWQELLDWQKIYNWADAKPANTVLGQSCTNSDCPLAEYFNEVTGRPFWSVGPVIMCGDGRGITLKKPAFIQPLIATIDQPRINPLASPDALPTGKNESRDITREQFLRALEAVKEKKEQ